MANVLSEDKKQQVLALERLGWSLRRIEQATGVRPETASAYLKAAGVSVRSPGGWGRWTASTPANPLAPDVAVSKPAIEVTTDFGAEKPVSATSSDLHPKASTTDSTSKTNLAKPATRWVRRLPSPFTPADLRAGYVYELAFRQRTAAGPLDRIEYPHNLRDGKASACTGSANANSYGWCPERDGSC